MALSGVTIAFGLATADNSGATSLLYGCSVSQLLALPSGVSTIRAPGAINSAAGGMRTQTGQILLSVSASAAIFYATASSQAAAIAAANDSNIGPRRYFDPDTMGGREDIFVNVGDFFAFVAA